jgi:hypothetical protein
VRFFTIQFRLRAEFGLADEEKSGGTGEETEYPPDLTEKVGFMDVIAYPNSFSTV